MTDRAVDGAIRARFVSDLEAYFRVTARSRRPPVYRVCQAAGCAEVTKEEKPYCVEHLDELPYVQEVKARIAARYAEASEALRTGRFELKAPRVREVVSHLTKKAIPLRRLRIELDMPRAVAGFYVEGLLRHGMIKVMVLGSRRGIAREVIDLTEAGKAWARGLKGT